MTESVTFNEVAELCRRVIELARWGKELAIDHEDHELLSAFRDLEKQGLAFRGEARVMFASGMRILSSEQVEQLDALHVPNIRSRWEYWRAIIARQSPPAPRYCATCQEAWPCRTAKAIWPRT